MAFYINSSFFRCNIMSSYVPPHKRNAPSAPPAAPRESAPAAFVSNERPGAYRRQTKEPLEPVKKTGTVFDSICDDVARNIPYDTPTDIQIQVIYYF